MLVTFMTLEEMHKILVGGLRKFKFSSVAFELGKKVPVNKVDQSTSKLYELSPLNGITEALNAFEGSVVVVSSTQPSTYDMSKLTFFNLFNLLFDDF